VRALGRHLGGSPGVVIAGGTPSPVPGVSGVIETSVDGVSVRLVPVADLADDGPAMKVAGRGAGVGAAFATVDGLTESYRQASFALRVALSSEASGRTSRWADLGYERLLINVDAADPLVRRLICDLAQVPELRNTAEVFLDHAGNVQGAAAALHIHRQTLYYRLTRIESVTGLDLASGTDRLLLHLTVKLARLA
jgi:DNA-binding PucR family transcriptional regulator